MSEDDLIRRGTAEKLLRDLQDDLVKKGQHQDALTIGMAADLIAMGPDAVQPAPDVADQERNYLHLHQAAYDVWRWFETARPDLIGRRAEALRDAVTGPRPYSNLPGHVAQPTPELQHALARLDRRKVEVKALQEACRYWKAQVRANGRAQHERNEAWAEIAELTAPKPEELEDVGILQARVEDLQRIEADLRRELARYSGKPVQSAPTPDVAAAISAIRKARLTIDTEFEELAETIRYSTTTIAVVLGKLDRALAALEGWADG